MLVHSSSTPGKEYSVRKTCLGGTPLRLAVVSCDDDADGDAMCSPKDVEGSFITRVPVRATSAQKVCLCVAWHVCVCVCVWT